MTAAVPGRRPAALRQALLAAVVAALMIYPLLSMVLRAAGNGPSTFGRLLFTPGAGRAWMNSFGVGVVASLLALVAATGAQAATRGVRSRVGVMVRAGVLLPLLVPPFAAAVGWSQAYGPGGLSDVMFHLPVRGVIGPGGVVLATSAEVMPIAFLILQGAGAIFDDHPLTLAARASGSTRWSARRRVVLPLIRPAAAAALTLSFLAAVNNFTVPAVLGAPAGFETVTSRIYNDLNFATSPSAFVEAQVLATSLALGALLILLPGARLLGSGAAAAAPGVRRRGPSRGTTVAQGCVGAYLAATTAAPLAALALTALVRAPGLSPSPGNWSLLNFQQALAGSRFLPAVVNSLVLAIAAATLLVALGLAVAGVERRPGGRVIASAVTLGFAVPGSVLAVAFLLTYGRWIGGSLLIILLAYAAKLWALAHRPISGAMRGLPPDLSLAARASGAGQRETLRTIVAPLLGPALAAAWVLVFLFALHEVTMSSLLYGPASQTLAVLVLNVEQVGDIGTTAALACALTVLVMLPTCVLGLLLRSRPGRPT